MKITITCRKCSPSESFKERVDTKLAKVEKFFGADAEAQITVTAEKTAQIVELTVMRDGIIFRVEESAEDMNDAFDSCVDLLIRQIRKHKTRLEKRLHRGGFDQFIDAEPVSEELEFDIVRTKTISMKPQNIEEAILQMNMLNHQFYMFINSSTDKINVVYTRKDGGYGVIESA